MPRKSKLESMTQTHGKEEVFQPLTLDQIWGDDGKNKYNTMDEEVYLKYLNSLGKSEIQDHAAKVSIIPIEDRERLVKRLLHEFRLHVASYRFPTEKPNNNTQKVDPQVAKILAEGR